MVRKLLFDTKAGIWILTLLERLVGAGMDSAAGRERPAIVLKERG